jgi:hypothetical protein
LKVSEGAQSSRFVTRVEQSGGDAAQVAWPDEVVDVIAVVIAFAPRRAGRCHERAGVRLVLEAAQDRERRAREHSLVSADLAQRLRQIGESAPCAFERLANLACALLQDLSRDLFGIRARVSKANCDGERSRPDANLSTDRDVAGPCAVVRGRQVAVPVVKVDLQVRALEVADGGSAEGPDDADPHVLLTHQQGGRMRVEDLAEVALRPRLPMSRGLHVELHVGQLRSEGGADQDRVFLGIREVVLGQAVFVMSAVDGEPRSARSEPRDPVLPVTGVIDRRRSAGGCEEAQLVQRDAVDGWKEDLTEGAVGEGVPELALRSRRRPERHLSARTPHRRCSRPSWCLHR